MKKKITILTIAICLSISILMLTACFDDRTTFDTPTDATITVTHNTITVTNVRGVQGAGIAEFSLDGNAWQLANTFSNLIPNTLYRVHIRQPEDERNHASGVLIREVTTLRQNQDMPNVNYTQSNRTITLTGATSAMEVAFDGETFGSETTHTFTVADNGERIIRVRYRQTEQANASEAQEISVRISNFYGGRGTAQDPFRIRTFENFQAISGFAYFELIDDIQFPSEAVSPINVSNVRRIDGNGFSILEPILYNSLFLGTSTAPDLSNLNIIDAVLTMRNVFPSNLSAGNGSVIAGVFNNSAISNVHISANIDIEIESTIATQAGYAFAFGAIAGSMNNGHIVDSSADITLSFSHNAVSSGQTAIGGLLGRGINTTIENSHTNIDFDLSDIRRGAVGGLVGGIEASGGTPSSISIENSFALGAIIVRGEGVTATDTVHVGGLVGLTGEAITNSYSSVDLGVSIVNQNLLLGGIAGRSLTNSNPAMENVFFAGNIAVSSQLDSAFTVWQNSMVAQVIRDVVNGFHIDTLSGVEAQHSTAISEADLHSIIWQRANLNFDEEIWQLSDGQLPILR